MTHSPAAIMSADEVAAMLACAAETVRELARAGTLPGLKLGRDWVFPAGALVRALEAQAEAQAQQRRQPARPAATVHARRAGPPALPALVGCSPKRR